MNLLEDFVIDLVFFKKKKQKQLDYNVEIKFIKTMWEGYLLRFKNFDAENRTWMDIEINILHTYTTNEDLY